MNWADERYVRVYTRDTAEWLAFCWQAKALMPLLLRKADRAGVVAVRPSPHRARLVGGLVGLPEEVAATGLADLLTDGCLVQSDVGFVFRNFIDAQETEASGSKRAREYRERERERALSGVTKRDDSSRNVTEPSRNVTASVTDTQVRDETVTPNRAVPCRAVPSRAVPEEEEEAPATKVGARPEKPDTPSPQGALLEVFEHYRATFKAKQLMANGEQCRLIEGRLREGYSVEDLKRAITGLSRSDWHTRQGQVRLEGALKDGERVENCWRWLEHPPDQEPTKGRASEADRDWTKPVELDADGQVVL